MITSELLAKIFPGTKRVQRDRFLPAFNKYCPQYGIDSYLRFCAFLATGGIETDYLRTTIEYASGADYEGRKDLGNVYPGDGRKFRGHGFFQTTGRANHRRVTEVTFSKLGIDFEKHPEKLAEIDIAVESACIFWRDNNLSKYADARDFFAVSGIVNRGSAKKKALHFDKRNALYKDCLNAIPQGFSFDAPQPAAEISATNVEPVVLTPTETSDDFLTSAFDKNVTPEDVKALARQNAPSLLRALARPFVYLGLLLEAGNFYAWAGVVLFVFFLAVEIYLHRARIKKLWEKLKAKFTA